MRRRTRIIAMRTELSLPKEQLNSRGDHKSNGRGLLRLAACQALWMSVFALFVFAESTSAIAAHPSDGKKTGPRYNHDIRPILSDNCFYCHGPDKNKRKAKLRLDVREVAVEKEAIIPGKPDESQLVKRIYTTDADDVMPPPETHKTLTAEQKQMLRQWIAEGAEYEPHWAYVKPARPVVPDIKNPQRVRNPIDAFILHALETRGIQPSPEADKRTVLRRLSLDLIGLPPTREEVESFLHDSSSKAYERQVD